jgi:hypothetical protein
MKLEHPRRMSSPRASGLTRLAAEVSYKSRFARPETVWFDIPDEFALGEVPANAFVLGLLPLAMSLQESLQVEPGWSVDASLIENLQSMMRVWHQWYPARPPVVLLADRAAPGGGPDRRRHAAFFSGGIDSFFTVLHSVEEADAPLDDLIFIHGEDIPIGNRAAYDHAKTLVDAVGSALHLRVVPVATNLRSTLFSLAPWNGLAFGPLMAASALSLGQRYATCLIPATGRKGKIPPLGSHPETDPFMSTSFTKFIHHGDWLGRMEKTAWLSGYPLALENLRVCWESANGDNCGRCGKCLRTMATLDVLGVLDQCPTFPKTADLPDAIRRLYLSHELPFILEVRDFAAERGRQDIAAAIEAAVRRSEQINRWFMLGLVQSAKLEAYGHPRLRLILRQPYGWLRRLAVRFNRSFG